MERKSSADTPLRSAHCGQFLAQLEDTCASFRAGITYLTNHHVTGKRILLGGQSAGAQLVSLLAYNQEIEIPERPLFAGLVAISGPLDFSVCRNRTVRRLLRTYIGRLSNPEIADPIFYARPDIPISVLCLHGGKDPLVDVENSKSFVNKLNRGATQRAKIHILPQGHHSDLVNLFLKNSVEAQFLTIWLEEVGQQ